MAGLIELLRVGQEELETERLEDAEKSFNKALNACSTDEDRQEVLRCLLKLAGKYLRKKIPGKPAALYEYLAKADVLERTRAMEWLARLHQQTEDLAGAEKIYTEIFEQRASVLGPEHPDVVGALKTAALLRQMQGKSSEELYLKAYDVSKAAALEMDARQKRQKKYRPTQEVVVQIIAPKKPPGWDDKIKGKTKQPQENIIDDDDFDIFEDLKPRAKKTKISPLFLLDQVINGQASQCRSGNVEEIPEFVEPPLTLEKGLQELIAAWEPFCNLITKQLVKLLQQNANQVYRNTLMKLSALLNSQSGIKRVDLENPYRDCARDDRCKMLDWEILKELAPVYAAYDGNWNTYPFEIGTIYGCLRRAFGLGPLNIDTLDSIYRLAHIYSNEMFGCYDLEFAVSAYKICLLAFKNHPEIDNLARIRCRNGLAMIFMSRNELKEAKEVLKESIKFADSCDQISGSELLSILKSLGECTTKMGDFETAASIYERIRNFQEAYSRDAELFETLILLFSSYKKAGNEVQAQTYQRRLNWELDWLEDANPIRESIAHRAEELGEFELAELLLHDIILKSTPFEPIAGRAAHSLIKIYEKTGREEMAAVLKGKS